MNDTELLAVLNRIADLLERIADAVAPTPEQQAARTEQAQWEASVEALAGWEALRKQGIVTSTHPIYTNAIGGPQTGRGVR